jgi:hypothetical protein
LATARFPQPLRTLARLEGQAQAGEIRVGLAAEGLDTVAAAERDGITSVVYAGESAIIGGVPAAHDTDLLFVLVIDGIFAAHI